MAHGSKSGPTLLLHSAVTSKEVGEVAESRTWHTIPSESTMSTTPSKSINATDSPTSHFVFNIPLHWRLPISCSRTSRARRARSTSPRLRLSRVRVQQCATILWRPRLMLWVQMERIWRTVRMLIHQCWMWTAREGIWGSTRAEGYLGFIIWDNDFMSLLAIK